MKCVRLLAATVLFVFLFASCGPEAASTPAATPSPVAAATTIALAPTYAEEIRFGLIGNVTSVNVWALFDARGYSYNNYAVMSGYWPRLYQLSIPDRNFETIAASGMPSPFQQEESFYTATVPLRTNLKWTDGTPFTADDVAFTINTALSFQLGYDWHDFYNPDYIDHVEAVDAHTVKFYFKQQPNVSVWQYGALQGPIVQKAYWNPRVSVPVALLPSLELSNQIASLTSQIAQIQSKIDQLNKEIIILPVTSTGYAQTKADIQSQQAGLNQTNTALAKAQSQYDSSMDAARQSLYALVDTNEPTLGDWIPAGEKNGTWINKVNPAHPFNAPHFGNAVYKIYSSENDAVRALQNNEIDSILEPNGLSLAGRRTIGNSASGMTSQGRNLFFLVSNSSSNSVLSNPALRQAVACMIDDRKTAGQLGEGIGALRFFMLPGETFWNNPNATLPCNTLDPASRMAKAVQMLKTAGYTWKVLPSRNANGQGLTLPGGQAMPTINLLVEDSNQQAIDAGNSIRQQLAVIGLPLTVQSVSSDELHYDVFSSHQFDAALLGWQVSAYPLYLCNWFGTPNPFGYSSDRLQSACEALNSTSDLSAAQKDVYQIQSILAQDLPFLPLYSSLTYDAYRNIKYPFDSVLDGLSGIYGAPSFAMPVP